MLRWFSQIQKQCRGILLVLQLRREKNLTCLQNYNIEFQINTMNFGQNQVSKITVNYRESEVEPYKNGSA